MRKAVFPLIVALMSASVLADVEITREEAGSIKSYDISDVEEKGPTLDGQLVKLKFNYRSKTVSKTEDGGLNGQLYIWRSSTGSRSYKYGNIPVIVPKEGADWFMRISSEESRSSIVVFARLKSGKYGWMTAELLGREIKTDLKGSRIIW